MPNRHRKFSRKSYVIASLFCIGMFAVMVMLPPQLGGPGSVKAEWTQNTTYDTYLAEVQFYNPAHQLIGSLDFNQNDVLYMSAGTTIDFVRFVIQVDTAELSTPQTWKSCINVEMTFVRSTGPLSWWSGWTEVSSQGSGGAYTYIIQSVDMNFVIESSYTHNFQVALKALVN